MTILKHLKVSDFRSILGTVNVPLDAPVVLIHGQNGTGKTSLLSAIELGLSGRIPSLDLVDSRYRQHLVHKSSLLGMALVDVETQLSTGQSSKTSFSVTGDQIEGKPLLSKSDARFYSERCFLAQSTLARLLEIYERSDAKETDSQLTRFVKDLLGLDHLDSLIDGLHDAGHVRRIVSKSAKFKEVREEIPRLRDRLKQQSGVVQALKEELLTAQGQLLAHAKASGLSIDVNDISVLSQLNRATELPEDPELRQLNAARVTAASAREQWQTLDEAAPDSDRSAAELGAELAERTLNQWRENSGNDLVLALTTAQLYVQELSPLERVGPKVAHANAQRTIRLELDRCATALKRAAEIDSKVEAVTQEIERARARVQVLDAQIAEHAADAGGEANMLTAVLPHVHSDDCPICGRDFGEILPGKPLSVFLQERINTLNQSVSRLQTLMRERTASSTLQASSEREFSALAGTRFDIASRDDLKLRESALTDLDVKFRMLQPVAKEGQDLTDAAALAVRHVSEQQLQGVRAQTIREDVGRLADSLSIDPLSQSESVVAALDRIDAAIASRLQTLLDRQAARREAGNEARNIVSLNARLKSADEERVSLQTRMGDLQARFDLADSLMHEARELGRRARTVRTDIVRRVFNEDLNTVWRDLFVRLAPEESFVPRFALPTDADAPVAAVLETIYRAGEVGGNPRSMLSAGNLNTAALTLFLALHLSVTPSLPCLVLDDPVQSMDEVHIAQLAALFRTLSKVHKRQLIVAVHEKPLFDYLSLELSPAFESDKLITVELSRDSNGMTIANFNTRIWQPDKAIAA